MKTLFSPAITLMNQLNYGKKFAFLGTITLLAISILIYSLYLSLNQVVQNSQEQLKGLQLIPPISLTIQTLQQHRDWSASFLAGDEPAFSDQSSKEFEVSLNFKKIENPLNLKSNPNWIKIKNGWANIVSNGLEWTIAKNFSEHTLLLEQLQLLKVLLADEHSLTFDSDIDAFYLIDTSINKLPEAIEQLAQLRAIGTNILLKKQLSAHQRIEISTLIAKLESSLKLLNINLRKTASLTPNIAPKLTATSSNITISAQQVIQLIHTDILTKAFHTEPKLFFSQVSLAINESYADMYQTLLPTIRTLITERLQHAKNRLYLSIAISLVLMLMVLYFVLGIYFSMKQSVQSLTHSLKLFSDGDLAKRIDLRTEDELKHIGNSFNLLAEKITFLLADAKSSQNKIQQILDGLLTMAGILLPDGTLDFANSTPLRLSGLKQQDVIGKKLWDCPWFSYSVTTKEQVKNDCLLAAQGEAVNREIEFALLDSQIWVDFSVHPVFGDQGEVKFLVAEARDTTRRRLAEEHSKRSQKMDALGKLVGGIAHDYNNMLGVILGYAELLEMKYQDTDQGIKGYLTEIIRAGERGRTLTRKMLAFSKSESSNPDICNINKTLFDLKDMLAKSLTASITLNYALYEEAWPIWIDVNELEDTILNMSINAKYAMPEGGSLTIKTQNIHLAWDEAKLLGVTKNNYLKLSIIDTGCGMDEETKNHAFDPFFTTKGDAGNGLGLSQVFGFVERSGGAINIYTQLNYGTELTLYFPCYDEKNKHNEVIDNKQTIPHLSGHESILVIDDEPALRELAYQILTHFGYKVLTASSGEAALNILLAQSDTIDLVLSDIIMPNMDGYQLAKHISSLYPSIKIQLASGFSDNRHPEFNQSLQESMLNKPYSSKELLTSIRMLLDETVLPEGIKND